MAEYPKLYRSGVQIKMVSRANAEILNINRSAKRVYHKHTGTEANGQGCYTVPVYHTHSGQAGLTYSNGCYTVPQEVPGDDEYCGEWEADVLWDFCGCSGWELGVADDLHDADGYCWFAKCTGCGEYSSHCPGGYSHTILGSLHTEYVVGCGKTPGVSIDKYKLSCGYEV